MFSSALLILDDIVASTALQRRPRLYEQHESLLSTANNQEGPIDLEAVIGCQNWVLLQVAEIAVLDEWKQNHTLSGDLDVMELVNQATAIRDSLLANPCCLESNQMKTSRGEAGQADVFTIYDEKPSTVASQSALVTQVWAHAALIYLIVVACGWEPTSSDVRYRVDRVIELLTGNPALLRTMVWPFCVAGCLAQPAQHDTFRRLVAALKLPSVFGAAKKALELMEKVWSRSEAGETVAWDFGQMF